MKVTIELSEDDEGTLYPWWLIVNPTQMMSPHVARVAMGMIDGPFFSRESAERYLLAHRYNYGKHAKVWCASGCHSCEWRNAIDNSKKRKREVICLKRKKL